MEGPVKSLATTLPLNIDSNSEELQQLYDMINRGRTVSESEKNCHSIDWIDVIPPAAFEDPILNWDITIGDNIEEEVGMGLNSLLSGKVDITSGGYEYGGGDGDILQEIMEMESDIEDAMKDINIENFIIQGDDFTHDHLEQRAFRAINNYIKEGSSRDNDIKNFWEMGLMGILNDQQSVEGPSRGTVQQGTVSISTVVDGRGDGRGRYETMMSSSTDEDSGGDGGRGRYEASVDSYEDSRGDGGRGQYETSVDSYDSGQSDSSGSGSDDDYSSPEPGGGEWFQNMPLNPIVIEPEEMCYSDDEAENEEVDIMNFTDERLEGLCSKTRPFKMTVLENVLSDHCYCSRVIDRSKSIHTTDSRKTIKHIPSPQKSKCSRPSNIDKHIPRGQKNGVKCGRRKLAETSRAISSAKRNSRGRVLKNAIEKRQQLNHMERVRRGGLKTDFQRLRLVVPQTSSNPKAPKDTILQCALTTIITLEESYKIYEEELIKLTKEHNLLRKSLKQYTAAGASLKFSRQNM